MGVPRARRTKSKQGHRRSHLGLKKINLISCAKCGAKNRPHAVCGMCGYYKGRLVIDIAAQASKRKAKQKAAAR